jgi:hypothetical protein
MPVLVDSLPPLTATIHREKEAMKSTSTTKVTMVYSFTSTVVSGNNALVTEETDQQNRRLFSSCAGHFWSNKPPSATTFSLFWPRRKEIGILVDLGPARMPLVRDCARKTCWLGCSLGDVLQTDGQAYTQTN